uniref:KH domain-containing protein At4g18375-like n=1 Tax=Erigeron canadensis TaxID=72917 RepID=UPI001CB93322|nr:KH domain-containing protein At4g18375-like [Erigeron canadensis]
MDDNKCSPYKRNRSPFSEKGGNKRRKYGDQSCEDSNASETVYQILCDSRKIGGVIGKGGRIVEALREETQAKITVTDPVCGSDERIVLIYSLSTKKPVNHTTDGNLELHCAAQDALLKVHDHIVEEDVIAESGVTARLLVPNNIVGCLLGKKGDVIQRLRSETGANIRILPSYKLPVCAMNTDTLVQISGKPAIAKRALYEVSTLLHQNPRKDKPLSGFPYPHSHRMTNLLPPANPLWSDRGSHVLEHSRFGSVDFCGDRPVSYGREALVEFSMKILCPNSKIGEIIGKGGSNIRQLRKETGTDIHVDDIREDSDERMICVSSFEDLWNPRSRTINAILILQDKTMDPSKRGIITTRLLIPSIKVGCILGQGGQIIDEMSWRTKADIHIYSKEKKPKCTGRDETLVQVSGTYVAVKHALAEIASRYRERYLRDAKSGLEPSPPSMSQRNLPVVQASCFGGYEPSKGSGREYEPTSYPAPPRDYGPYKRSASPGDYKPFSHSASQRYYEPDSYPSRSRESKPYTYQDPPRDNEPYGHAGAPMVYKRYNDQVPSRDYERYIHPASPKDYELCSLPGPSRDYASYAPPRDDEPTSRPGHPMYYKSRSHYSSLRDLRRSPNATGYPGHVDEKMPSSSPVSAIGTGVGNADEVSSQPSKLFQLSCRVNSFRSVNTQSLFIYIIC